MTPDGQDPPKHSIYDLRHTFAHDAPREGVPITYIAAQMGHANPATTLRFYARWVPKEGRRYVELLLGPHEVPQAVPAPELVTS